MSRQTMRAAIFGALLMSGGCDGLFDVTNPGPVLDEDLETAAAMPGLVVGMSGDLSVALSQTAIWGSIWSDDLFHSGTLGAPTIFATGAIEASDIDPWWDVGQRARWTAENGIERMKDVLGSRFETFAQTPRAYLHAGYSNRILGENTCQAVIDGGPALDHTEYFRRAEQHFTEGLRIAQAQGSPNLANAARAGRAQVRAALGDWGPSAQDAQQVPVAFRYDAIFSLNTAREGNGWQGATLTRGEYTVWNTEWAETADDPRIPWIRVLTPTGAQRMAANGRMPWFAQQKYRNDGAPIALAKGTEMLLIRAEGALVSGDVAAAMALINQGRAHNGLSSLSATTPEEAWPILRSERGKTLWLEGRRFWDLRRWSAASGPARVTTLEGRDSCVPISERERLANPNIS